MIITTVIMMTVIMPVPIRADEAAMGAVAGEVKAEAIESTIMVLVVFPISLRVSLPKMNDDR